MINFGVTEQKTEELRRRMQTCGLLEKDVEETFVRSRGAGGQNVNKTSTCVQLKHLPTGLAVKVQQSRSQSLNRFYSRRQLCQLLESRLLGKDSPKARKISKIRKQKDRRNRRRKTDKITRL
jgi:protein subunit release factor B